jgi:hypothetical protein
LAPAFGVDSYGVVATTTTNVIDGNEVGGAATFENSWHFVVGAAVTNRDRGEDTEGVAENTNNVFTQHDEQPVVHPTSEATDADNINVDNNNNSNNGNGNKNNNRGRTLIQSK